MNKILMSDIINQKCLICNKKLAYYNFNVSTSGKILFKDHSIFDLKSNEMGFYNSPIIKFEMYCSETTSYYFNNVLNKNSHIRLIYELKINEDTLKVSSLNEILKSIHHKQDKDIIEIKKQYNQGYCVYLYRDNKKVSKNIDVVNNKFFKDIMKRFENGEMVLDKFIKKIKYYYLLK